MYKTTSVGGIMDKNISFGSATRMYFFSSDGKRIVTDENLRKCQRYVVRHLNNDSRLKERNMDLVRNFTYDKRQGVGDSDFYNIPKVRSVYEYAKERAKAFVNIITGKDVKEVDSMAKPIGKAKHTSLERIGETRSFETGYAVDRYNAKATKFADEHGIYKDGKRQAFGVIFNPVYKKNGDLKGFEYNRSGYFDESFITESKKTPELL